MRILCMLLILFLSGLSCKSKIDESNIRLEIWKYWNESNIDGVAIMDVSLNNKTAKVSASLIVFDDTLRDFIYTFEKFQKSWKIIEGPADNDNMMRMALSSYIEDAQRSTLKANMHIFQMTLEDYNTQANGKYPANLNIPIKDIFPNCKTEDGNLTLLTKLPSHLRNPYNKDESAVCLIQGYPWDWEIEYIGKVIFIPTPLDIKGKVASGYVIRGSTNKGFISLKLSDRLIAE